MDIVVVPPAQPHSLSQQMPSFSSPWAFLPVSLLLLTALFSLSVALRTQSIAVKGQLKCGNAPASRVRVKLFDEDDGPDPDDQLDAGYTDASGQFNLQGHTTELTAIDPVFKVYHDCDDGLKPGSRKVKFRLPKSYISDGSTPKKTFDVGVINLEMVFQDEERELIVTKRKRHLHGKHHRRHADEEFQFFEHF